MARGGHAFHADLATPTDHDQPWALTAEAAEAWVAAAKAGDRTVYARGPRVPKCPGVAALQEHHDRGRVTFTAQRHGAFDYSFFVTRLAEPSRPAPAARIVRPVHDEDYDDVALLMALLRRKARLRQPMGTNRELGDAIGVGPDRIAYLLRKQISAGKIAVEAVAIGVRVTTIVATGARTAGAPS